MNLSKVSRAEFDRDLLPAIHRFAEWAQLMPASEAHHHANIGGLLAHTLETLHHALVQREGYLLPRNGGAELIAQQRDAWTYAVFLGALVHDVGKPLTDLRIEVRHGHSESTRWLPLAGSLVECKATEYRVGFAPRAERDYAAHGRIALVLLQKIAPPGAMALLGRHSSVLEELTQYLSSDARAGALAEIVERADQQSTRHNLQAGTRARFGTARAVPLIEQLMQAMRDMLAQGALALNRDGAAGWVYDGAVWFVAKRLADEVREHIVRRDGDDAGVPGPAKNDRLFDTWQEYAQLDVNPLTQQAVWHVIVHGEDGNGYAHRLSVLKFPLAKVWRDASSYPAPMSGRIEVVVRAPKDGDVQAAQPALTGQAAPSVAGEARAASAPPSPAKAAAAVELPMPKMPSAKASPRPAPAAAAPSTSAAGAKRDDEDELIDPAMTARAGRRSAAPAARATPAAAAPAAVATPPGAEIGRTVLHQRTPKAAQGSSAKEPSAHAVAFVRWVLDGLGDGSITYNQSGALVHFVTVGELVGMGLVTPAIFREYALARGEPDDEKASDERQPDAKRVGLSIQREFLRAGWHAPSPADSQNFWEFVVAKRGGTKVSKLSLVVLPDARRFVLEPPPANPALQLPGVEAAGSTAAL